MPTFKLLPDGTPEEQAATAKAAALAEKLHSFLTIEDPNMGVLIEAVGLIFALKSKNADHNRGLANAIWQAVINRHHLKEKAGDQAHNG